MATSEASYNAKTEALEVVERFKEHVKGKTILITGVGPNGLGSAIAEALASQAPGLLILTGRSLDKTELVRDAIQKKFPSASIRLLLLDLSSFASVHQAVETLAKDGAPPIDILINNAGVMNIATRTLSADGFEMQLAVNYLGAFLLTNLLLQAKLLNTSDKSARIVMVGSNGYMFSPFRFSDCNFEDDGSGSKVVAAEEPPKALYEQYGMPWGRGYHPVAAYGQSKTAGILFAVQLNKLLADKGVKAVCLMPGAIATELWRHMPKEMTDAMLPALNPKSLSQGASTPLVAALDPKVAESSCLWLEDCRPGAVLDFAKDPSSAEKLWTFSQKLVRREFSY